MNILIACEQSQVVRNAFVDELREREREREHNIYSNDLIECTGGYPEWHLQMDAREALKYMKWDLIIAHPVCTRLANSGVLRLYKGGKKINGIDPIKWQEMLEAVEFFKLFLDYNGIIAIENPIMHGHAKKLIGVHQSQIIQPYNFGDDASKATCLWLKGLPLLKSTGYFMPRLVNGKKRWGNQTDSGQNKLPPSASRASERSITYKGIAQAMASQWAHLKNIQQKELFQL